MQFNPDVDPCLQTTVVTAKPSIEQRPRLDTTQNPTTGFARNEAKFVEQSPLLMSRLDRALDRAPFFH